MPTSSRYGEALIDFVDRLLAGLVERGLVEYKDGRYRLTEAGQAAAGERPGDTWAMTVLLALHRLGAACGLEVPRVP